MPVLRIGLISDTHGLLRPQALEALRGSDHIIHAGDIGSASILEALGEIAPVSAIRGNNDTADWARDFPESLTLTLAEVKVHVLHDLKALTLDPPAMGIGVVVAGHSHRPLVQERAGVLVVNPGSAGPRRFSLPVSVAVLQLDAGQASARIVTVL